jgi:signal transduction histidine kinase
METFVNDLLDLQQIKNGVFKLVDEVFDPNDVLELICDIFSP